MIPNKSFGNAIFDLDGVLVDTAELHFVAWKKIADELGVPFDRKKNERLRGVPRMRSLEIIVEDLPQRPTNMEALATSKNALYVKSLECLSPADVLPGVLNLLTALRRHGVRLALGSSSCSARTVLECVGLAPLFDAVVDGNGFVHGKPAPDVFLNAARLLGAEPAACVVVEDAQSGIEAAKAAGMFAVGIARDEPLHGADLVVRAPAEIPFALWGIRNPPGASRMKKTPRYRDPAQPIAARVKDLLKRMTLEEKAGQLISTCPVNQVKPADYTDEQVIVNGRALIDRGVGQLGVAVRHASPVAGPRIANALQRYALEKSRLGIPVLIQDECVHGAKSSGSTVFPLSIGMAATWNVPLLERVVHAIGRETHARGINQCFSPTLNIARDVRCGRVEETYGEDPYLVTRMGVAFVKTLQEHGVASTPKHFAANFVGDGGRDSHAVHFSERILREVYFPAFQAAVQEAGAQSIMIAHTAIDGIPCSNNAWLMNDVLRREWGFKGFIVPDNTDVQKNFAVHSQAESYEQSAQFCIEAGLDTDLSWPPPDPRLCYLDWLPKLVREGKVAQRHLDASVARVLTAKFEMGLFENPYVSETEAAEITQCAAHRTLAREAALESLVLLKNDGVLPLTQAARTLAIIGPSAKKPRLGGYTCDEPDAVSPLAGLEARAPAGTKLLYAEGCHLMDADRSGFAQAVRIARKADVVLMFMGNSSDKVVGQPETTEGERHDRCNLDLPGVQEDLILAVTQVNPRVVVILQNGSAITMRRWLGSVGAVLESWYPGAECGHAIAEALYGDYNPAGRLPITFPATTGQCPLYYNPRPHGRAPDYCDHRGRLEQFAFGFGLSYTRFEYSALRVTRSERNGELSVRVACTVTNTGDRDGDEVVQLYLRDCYSRITRPILELKRFQRVHVKSGASCAVAFTLKAADFMYLDQDLKPVLEPGDFNIMLAASSADIRLQKILRLP